MSTLAGGSMARFLALLIFAGTASAGQAENAARVERALRLPTPAGNAVAEVSGTPALDFGTLDDEDFGPRFPSAMPEDALEESSSFEWRDTKLGDSSYRGQRDWRFRGSVTQEDVVDGATDWRFGAWISREF